MAAVMHIVCIYEQAEANQSQPNIAIRTSDFMLWVVSRL